MTTAPAGLRMPAEWEPHRATWICWPHHEPDWPGKLGPIPWVYAEIVRVLVPHETVEVLCHTEAVADAARATLEAHGVPVTAPTSWSEFFGGVDVVTDVEAGVSRHTGSEGARLHIVPSDRVWLRDSAPTSVVDRSGHVALVNWAFNGWAKYDNWRRDAEIGRAMARVTGLPRREPRRPDTGERVVLEGGGIEVNGAGIVMVTEEWLLGDVQVRNPGLTRTGYEALFAEWLGAPRTIWLGEGCVGDDTHGHIDDIARFVGPDTVVLAYEADPSDDNHARSADNRRRLDAASGSAGIGPLRIVTLPFPRPVTMNGERLPASYANFYIGNGVVLVPTFNDPNDRIALNTIAGLMPSHTVVGIHAVDLVWGLGTIHCLTQQEPLGMLNGEC